jgi:hypothetical protein
LPKTASKRRFCALWAQFRQHFGSALRVTIATVLLKSIRQSRVTGVLDVTNFGTLSRVTEALDEYTYRHGRFNISIQGCSEQVSLATRTLPFSPFSRFLVSYLTNIVLQTKFKPSLTVKMDFFLFNNRFAQINFSDDS